MLAVSRELPESGGVIPPSEEDRKKIIRQMKVHTTLKEDKSWIYPQNSDNEEEMKRSSLHSPCRSGKINGGSPASASVTPHGNRLPGSKPTSGYLIRGVFTRTIDKTPPESTSYSNGKQKSVAAQAKSASLPCFSSGYKMTTEDYKKLAPFNVRQISVESDEEKPSFSPDEHKKRTEAANSVLRRTASRERSYVLSAAKKSNGNPTQEVPPFIARRVETEDEGGLHMRSQTLPASSRFGPDGKSINGVRKSPTGSSWSKPKPMTAVSTTSLDTDNKSQATRSWIENTSQISSYTESGDKVEEEKPVETSPGEATTPKPTLAMGRSDKPVKEEPDLISWDESVPKATTISTGERSSPQSRDMPAHPTDASFTASGYLGDTECDRKRSVPGYEERCPTREIRYESTRATEHKKPELNVAKSSPSSGDSSTVSREVQCKIPMHLDDEEFDFNSRSSSHSTEINVTTTDPRHRIPVCMEDGELDPERLSPLKGNNEDSENENISTTRSEPPTTRKHTEPDVNTAQLPSASSERISMSTASSQYHSPSAMGHKSNPSTASKGILFVKEYVNSCELSPTPRYSSDSLVDLSDIERASYLHSSTSQRSCEGVCTYCGREIRDCPKIMIEHLNVYCHEYCFRCGICHKAMGDLLDKIFIHRDIVHCDQCYETLF
ncbi:zinc finger protein 185 [Macrochelys suwanniensis]